VNNYFLGIILQPIGIVVFLYITWRRLKEDYLSSQIFNLLFTNILIILASIIVTNYFLRDYIFWAFLIGFLIGSVFASIKFGLKFIEVIEAEVFAILFYFTIIFLRFIPLGSVNELLLLATFVLLIPIFIMVERNYKNFAWYRSGRRGFTSMFIIGLFFLIRSLIALINPSMVFLLLDYDPIISGIISFVSFSIIFYLGRK